MPINIKLAIISKQMKECFNKYLTHYVRRERMTMHITDVEYKVQERLEELEDRGLHDPAIRIAFEELQKLQIWILEGIEY